MTLECYFEPVLTLTTPQLLMSTWQQRPWYYSFSLQDADALIYTGCRWNTLNTEQTQFWPLFLGVKQ